MSISKLFVKVFGEDIFEKYLDRNLDRDFDDDAPSCSGVRDSDDYSDDTTDSKALTLSEQMVIVKAWVQGKIDTVDYLSQSELKMQRAAMEQRLGPEVVIFDIDFTSTVRISADRLSVRSQGSFNTIKANACVFGGRWMYEVQLHSKGVMQLGWASNKCTFNENSGVGDSKYSFGFDGSKQQIWHISTKKYGEKWEIGDVIGLTIDFENDEIQFYRNGKPLGVAFTRIDRGPNITYFPAVSLGYNQGLNANFGGIPFRYPVTGFMPIQAKPILKLNKFDLLLDYLHNLSNVIATHNLLQEKKQAEAKLFSTKKAVYVLFCTNIMDRITPMLFDSYVINDRLISYISRQCTQKSDNDKIVGSDQLDPVLDAFLSLLWNFLENDEARFVFRKICNGLLNMYIQTHPGLDYSKQLQSLRILNSLCNHTLTRKNYIENKFFKKHCLALFMYIRPPEYYYMQTFIPDSVAWTEGIGGPKAKYMNLIEKLKKSTEPVYVQQCNLLMTLLKNDDFDVNTASSRKLFLAKLRRYIMDASMEQRVPTFIHLHMHIIQHPIEAQVSLSFLCILVDITRLLLQTEMPGVNVEIPPKYFYDGSFEYLHFDRIGGVLSHLRKVHRQDIIQQLGAERTQQLLEEERGVVRVGEIDAAVFMTSPTLNNITIVGRNPANNTTTFTHFFNPRMVPAVEPTPGSSNVEASLYELLDMAVLFYYAVGHKYIVKIASVRDEIAILNDILKETKFFREDVEKKLQVLEAHAKVCMDENHCQLVADLKSRYSQRENVFAKRSIELARKQAWYRANALRRHRRLIFVWLLERVVKTINASSQQGQLFSFLPEIYINILPILLDAVMDFSYHDLVVQFDLADAECVINSSAEFLASHAADQRIILASCKDSLLQALGTLTCHRQGVIALERTTKKSQTALVRALLRPYENRAWGQSNWLLLRFWLGEGYAFKDSRQPSIWQGGNEPHNYGLCRSRAKNETHTGLLHHVAPAYPSKHYQKIIGHLLTVDEPFATAFLNSVLSQLNWAFSEFILLLQEIQNTALRQENAIFEPKQLKICSMCFELTVSLMRCLEMVISIAPEVFKDASRPNGDLILNRVCQLISQVLSRVTVPPGCFQFVIDMCSPDLNSVTHFPIITAALGILLALLRSELEAEQNPAKVTRISRALLTDPSFQFANLEFALGEVNTPILKQPDIPRGNFDPQQRAHIDPLTNDVRVPTPSTSAKRIRAVTPIIKFSLSDFPSHVTRIEIEDVRSLIEMLRKKHALLSEITLPSEDSLCPICCAKPIAVMFTPCKHQSCSNCILQHLMNSKVCFYCKTLIKTIETTDGTVIYENTEYLASPTILEQFQ